MIVLKKIIYIKEIEKTSGLKFILSKLKKYLNIIKIEDDKVYYLPIFKENKLSEYRIKKLTKKISILLEKDVSNSIVLSEYLNKNQLLKNYLYSKNVNILNGKFLFKCLTYKIIEYIFKIKNSKMESGEVSLLINDFTEINKEIIISIAKDIKRLNIVTNNISKCKKIEEYLYEEFGIILNISNNKRRSLLKSEIIINLDFPEELINKYMLYYNATIVNMIGKINIYSKRFNGININNYTIVLPEEYKLENFQNEIVYESLIYKKSSYKEINEQIIKDKIEIDKLIGNNGPIRENEIA